MKNHIKLISFISTFFLYFNVSIAQNTKPVIKDPNKLTFEDIVGQSDCIVEGEVIGSIGFSPNDNGKVYTSARVRISRIFRGENIDTTVEVVYPGGYYKGHYTSVKPGFFAAVGYEGIFFLKSNKGGPHFLNESISYKPFYGVRSMLYYHNDNVNPIAIWDVNHYKDLETEVFQQIEGITHIPRKVIGQNLFERPAVKKPQK